MTRCRHEVLVAQIAGNVIVSYKCRECGARFSPQPVPFEPKPIEVKYINPQLKFESNSKL